MSKLNEGEWSYSLHQANRGGCTSALMTSAACLPRSPLPMMLQGNDSR